MTYEDPGTNYLPSRAKLEVGSRVLVGGDSDYSGTVLEDDAAMAMVRVQYDNGTKAWVYRSQVKQA